MAPPDKILGESQRILYFHVGSALASYLAVGVMLVAALIHLSQHIAFCDALLKAATEVAFLFASITLLTGMIWGKAAWNVWFHWEPRLVTFLLLWMILLGIFFLREFSPSDKRSDFSAIMAIIAAVNVPLIMFSIRWIPAFERLHPEVVAKRGLKDPSYYQALGVCVLACLLLATCLILSRFREISLEERIDR